MTTPPNPLRRNGLTARGIGDDAAVGRALIDYMLERVGREREGLSLLDIGCGVRFAEAIAKYDMAFERYIGIELDTATIDYLKTHYSEPKFTFHQANQANAFYNPDGGHDFARLAGELTGCADLTCMFSVITHQNPDEARQSFDLAHAATRPGGTLFFTALIHGEGHAPFESANPRGRTFDTISDEEKRALKTKADAGEPYFEWAPDRPGFMSGYAQNALSDLARSSGWDVQSVSSPWAGDLPIQTSFVCERL